MRLAEFIRSHRESVLSEWEAGVRTLPAARELPRPALRDDVPDLLDRLAFSLEAAAAQGGGAVPLGEIPHAHALTRLMNGFDLRQLTSEYQILRVTLLRLWAAAAAPAQPTFAEIMVATETLDAAVRIAVERFTLARERTLAALDRISTAALGSSDPTAFLPKLMGVLRDSVPAIETVAILLADAAPERRDVLRLAAAVGLEHDLAADFSVRVGEGFAGQVAASRRALLLRNPGVDPLVRGPHLRALGLRVVYGAPMVFDGALVGVAHIGSRHADDFSDDDKVLFETMVHRATALLVQKRIERELATREDELRREAAFRERFLGIVGHDLRNPLSAVLFTADTLARREDLDEAVARGIRRIASSAHRMDRLVRDLLDFTRGRSPGGVPLDPRPADLHTICERAVHELELSHPARTVTLAASGDLRGVWDADRLAQVASNLIGNALDYSPAGTRVTVTVTGTARDAVALAVHNEGAPIPPALLATIFDPFRRGAHGAGTTPARKGLGLGTYIARLIVEAHGGTLEVASAAGAGTTFTARLPRTAPGAPR